MSYAIAAYAVAIAAVVLYGANLARERRRRLAERDAGSRRGR